jgi:hypothetical protein
LLDAALEVVGSTTDDLLAPTVTVGAPNGGERWAVGDQSPIRWEATDSSGIARVGLSYTTTGGIVWESISQDEQNDGEFLWTVPTTLSAGAKVRVVAVDVSGNVGSDESDGTFEIVEGGSAPPAPALVAAASALSVSVNWDTIQDADSYLLEEDDNPSFTSPVEYSLQHAVKYFAEKAPGVYYFRARAVN